VHSPQEAASKVREAKAAGFDLIKTHGGFDRETYDAMIGAAREAGLRVSGHVTSGYGLLHALESGQQVEHLDGYMAALMDEPHPAWDQQIVPDPDLLSQVLEDRMPALARKTREAGIANGPTLALLELIASDTPSSTLAAWPEMRYAPRQAREAWTKQIDGIRAEHWDKAAMQRFVDLRRAMVRALSDAGAPLLVGSDSPQFFLMPGFSAHREMEALEKAGIPPVKVLTAATVELARWAGQDGTWGTVAEGKRADLLVLDADPRETVANTRRIAGLVLHGKWLSRADLDKLLEDVASAAQG